MAVLKRSDVVNTRAVGRLWIMNAHLFLELAGCRAQDFDQGNHAVEIGAPPRPCATQSPRQAARESKFRSRSSTKPLVICGRCSFLLGQTKIEIESTVRYLGVDVEDALTLAEHTEV